MVEAEGDRGESPEVHGASPEAAKQSLQQQSAHRALAEAAERRKKAEYDALATEHGGRGGLEPVRYGDWEVKGLASDF